MSRRATRGPQIRNRITGCRVKPESRKGQRECGRPVRKLGDQARGCIREVETHSGVEQCLSQTETFTDTLAVGMENGAAPLGNIGAENTCSSDSAVPLLGLCPQELKAGS